MARSALVTRLRGWLHRRSPVAVRAPSPPARPLPRVSPALTAHRDRGNEALDSDREVQRAIDLLGWEHPTRWKTWDLLKTATHLARHHPDRASRILDAGCVGSILLEHLYAEGYRALYGCDLSSIGVPDVPGLTFWQGDLTRSPWPDGTFDSIVCLSVIEHGVAFDAFAAEVARLLKRGGSLILTTDYLDPKVDTSDVPKDVSFGLPWTIFSRAEIERLIEIAAAHGLRPMGPIAWEVSDPPVQCWGKTYSFLFLALQKA
jgi:SAM-dependent methyltransferase